MVITDSDGRITLMGAIAGYEERMRGYGFDAVRKSRAQMDGNGAIHKPIIGRAALAGMRAGMRLVNHTPPLKKRMAENMERYRGADRE